MADKLPIGGFVLAPNGFLHVFRGTVADHVRRDTLPSATFSFYVLHKGAYLDRIDPAFIREATAGTPVFANDVFVVFAPAGVASRAAAREHVAPLMEQVLRRALAPPADRVAMVVASFNRAWALRRTLRSLRRCGVPIIAVDDGSTGIDRLRNRLAAHRARAYYLPLPHNEGLPHALNVGICQALATPETQWISVTNDDVEIHPGALDVLVQVARAAPGGITGTILTGYDSPLHPVYATSMIAGHAVRFARSLSGQHAFAHRTYWQEILPIPTYYRGAPRRDAGLFEGHGSDEDWWFGSWSPASGVKRGIDVVVVPGLVTTFGDGRSTWGSPGR
ncbi:MAG: glycosyltransferase family 2 protein [Alphaproteobacteria bacterium]